MNKTNINLAYLYIAICRRGFFLGNRCPEFKYIKKMKKKTRPPRSSRTPTRGSAGKDNGTPGNRGRPRKNHNVATANFNKESALKAKAEGDVTQKHPDSKAKSSGKYTSISSSGVCYYHIKSHFKNVNFVLAAVVKFDPCLPDLQLWFIFQWCIATMLTLSNIPYTAH